MPRSLFAYFHVSTHSLVHLWVIPFTANSASNADLQKGFVKGSRGLPESHQTLNGVTVLNPEERAGAQAVMVAIGIESPSH